MAPSTSASLTIPLVFALAGNATWFVYLLATASMLLVGFLRQPLRAAVRFARIALHLHRKHAAAGLRRHRRMGIAARLPRHRRFGRRRSALLRHCSLGAIFPLGAARHSHARGGLRRRWIHRLSRRQAFRRSDAVDRSRLRRPDPDRACAAAGSHRLSARYQPIPASGRLTSQALGPALVLSIFSFVGFESATTLGGEARDPLRTIPRAVLQCALLAGVFFMLCAYSEVLGLSRPVRGALNDSTSPLHHARRKGSRLAARRGHRLRRVYQHVCLRAGLRHGGRARPACAWRTTACCPPRFSAPTTRHGTPGAAIALSTALMFAATAAMALSSA